MIDIIYIAYQFPPLNAGGSIRPLKFVKYFNEFGINPIVCTLHPESFPKVYDNYLLDDLLLKEIPANIDVRYIPSNDILKRRSNKLAEFFEIYFSPTRGNEAFYWKKNFDLEVDKIIKEKKPKLILITAPPFSMINLAISSAKKHNLPLIICMRDSMTMWVDHAYASYFHFLRTKYLEFSYFKYANAVVAVTQQIINEWNVLYEGKLENKFSVIPNGLDCSIEAVYSENNQLTINTNKEKLIIGYVGSFYYDPQMRKQIFSPWWKKRPNRMIQYVPRKEDWLYRSPHFFFKSISYLFKIKPELRNKISIEFVGQKPDWLDHMVSEFNLADLVKFHGMLPHKKSLEFQEKCDVLLATSTKILGGEDYCIAGKTFEYFTMKKPILAFVANGAQKEILEQSGMAVICNPDYVELSARKIYQLLTGKITMEVNVNFLKQFERKSLTHKLANLIKSTIQKTIA